jgi:hypothetical protein
MPFAMPSKETGSEGRNALIRVMGWTGGDRHGEALGKTDTAGMSEEEIGTLRSASSAATTTSSRCASGCTT